MPEYGAGITWHNMLIFINEQYRFTNSPAVATNSRWCQQQSPTASLAAVTGPKAKRQKMQKKKESKTSRQKHKSETEVACASSSSLALSLCHCVQWLCSLLLYSWCGWIRFDFYLTETDSLWLSLCLVVCVCVCVPRWLSICLGRATFCRCAHIHFRLLQMRISVLWQAA